MQSSARLRRRFSRLNQRASVTPPRERAIRIAGKNNGATGMARDLTTEDSDTLRDSSSTAATGGKGYTFADKVAAGFLVQMLARAFPLEPKLGFIAELHFETKESGRSLDDLQLVLRNSGSDWRWSVSVKSNR